MNGFKKTLCLLLACSATHAGYVLQSELRKNYNDGSPTWFYTGYTYDAQGNRIEKAVFDGVNANCPRMSTTNYYYDETTGFPTKELLLSDHDTASEVVFAYDGRNLLRAIILRNNGRTETCRDSLDYDGNGNCIRKTRYSSGEKRYFHTLTIDENGRKVADTLFELKNSSFSATMAVTFSYSADGLVERENTFQKPGDEWFPVKTAVMTYTEKVLSSVTSWEGDGAARRLIDSTAYQFDRSGNKIDERIFNADRELMISIECQWQFDPAIRIRKKPSESWLSGAHGKEIRLDSRDLQHICGRIFDMQGKQICEIGTPLSSGRTASGISSLKAGNYLIRMTIYGIVHTQKLTITK